MSNSNYIYEFADDFWQHELGCPTDISAVSISGWVTSQYTLGKLSNVTLACFSGISGVTTPVLGPSEFAVLSEMYKVTYYNSLAKKNLGAGGVRKVIELKEGDSTIKWQNENETAKIFGTLAKEAQNSLDKISRAYARGNGDQILSVDFYNMR